MSTIGAAARGLLATGAGGAVDDDVSDRIVGSSVGFSAGSAGGVTATATAPCDPFGDVRDTVAGTPLGSYGSSGVTIGDAAKCRFAARTIQAPAAVDVASTNATIA